MSLQSFSYFGWLPVVALFYLILPQRFQTPFLALASLFFFGTHASFDLSRPLDAFLPWAVMGFVFCLLWFLGPAIASASGKRRGRLVKGGVIALLAVLAIFKYYNYSPLPTLLEGTVLARLPFPLGISFFTFAAISYLVDLSREKIRPAKDPVALFVFLFFFGTIISGPICRAGHILPQLEVEHRFDRRRTVRALQLYGLGLWKKVAIADLLTLFIDVVYEDIPAQSGPMLVLGAAAFTLYLYFDFCGYSEMSRSTGMILGLELPENFSTPYLATNFTQFWARWHISLSQWLRDYLYIPLGGNRVSRGRHLFNLFLVMLVSGFWHGNTLPFVVWGALLGLYRVGEELLHITLGKPAPNAPALTLWAKRAVVVFLWGFTMIFFRIGSGSPPQISLCMEYIAGLFRNWSLSALPGQITAAVAQGFYDDPRMVLGYLAFLPLGILVAFWLDCLRHFRYADQGSEVVLAGQNRAVRWVLYYFLIGSILAGLIIQSGGFAGVSFAYANF